MPILKGRCSRRIPFLQPAALARSKPGVVAVMTADDLNLVETELRHRDGTAARREQYASECGSLHDLVFVSRAAASDGTHEALVFFNRFLALRGRRCLF